MAQQTRISIFQVALQQEIAMATSVSHRVSAPDSALERNCRHLPLSGVDKLDG